MSGPAPEAALIGRPVEFTLTITGRAFGVPGQLEQALPSMVAVPLVLAAQLTGVTVTVRPASPLAI